MAGLYHMLGCVAAPLVAPESLLLLLLAAGWRQCGLPLARRWLGRGAAGQAAALPLGWLLTVFIAWWAVQVSGGAILWTGLTLWISLLLVSGFAWWFWPTLTRVNPAARRAELIVDILFLAGFWLGVSLRLGAPAIVGQEKFMDLAMLGSCMTGRSLPPADPWLYTGAINYYYGGYLLMSAAGKMLNLSPEIFYNLAFGMIVGLVFQAAFALSYQLCRRAGWALLGMVTIALSGNLAPVVGHVRHWLGAGTAGMDWNHFVWGPSRVIVDGPPGGPFGETINEFPFFSWIVGDLHPHVMAAPFVLLLLLAITRSKWWLIGWLLGWLGFINGFDLISMAWVALVVALVFARRGGAWRAGLHWVGALLMAGLAFAPFYLQFHPPVQSPPMGLADFHSGLGEFLTVWGVHLWGVVALLVAECGRRAKRDSWRQWAPWLAVALAGGCCLAWCGLLVSGLLVALGILILRLPSAESPRFTRGRLALTLAFVSMAILLGCELVYVRDSYGHPLQRMNTLFKFYYPCWLMLGATLPFGLQVLARSRALGRRVKIALVALGAVLVLVAMEYPLAVGGQRLRLPFADQRITLDGMEWLRRETPADASAIDWLRAHGRPNEVVLEAVGDPYTTHARVATYTPLRAVMGWPNHEWIWRGNLPAELPADVERMFGEADFETVRPLLERYHVDYVFIGSLEHRRYPAVGLAKFERNMKPVYRDDAGAVEIFRVSPPTPSVVTW
jgi:YYY domain-containing protein